MKRFVIPVVGTIAAVSLVIGGIAIGRATSRSSTTAVTPTSVAGEEVWTCSMHPQVRLDRAGSCPICEMPLIPAASASQSADGIPTMQLSEHALAMASVETAPVGRRQLTKGVRAVGKIEYNESSLATITARIDGYAERLFVNFTGIDIRTGDHLLEIYSPDLLVAQRELLIALKAGGDEALIDTARIKLRLLGLRSEQIDAIASERQLHERLTLYSPIDGTVIEKMIVQNAAFKAGDVLYRIANLDTVWVYLDIYEYDLAWLRYGQTVDLTAESYPGRTFQGMVTFIQPIVNEATRTIRVPVHINNPDHALKPGMYVSAVINATLGPDGRAAPTGVEGNFTCPMHPQVLNKADGQCPICEMPLEQIPAVRSQARGQIAAHMDEGFICPMRCEGDKTFPEAGRCPVCNMKLEEIKQPSPEDGLLAVPVSAVLDSGTMTLVYVEQSRGLFEPRKIVVGPRAGEFYPVLDGLRDGERIVTRGGFLIDSQFQITGHSSLFYPGGLRGSLDHDPAAAEHGFNAAQPSSAPAGATGHQH